MKLSLGENIRRLRREKDMTQEQLAGALAVSFQAVSRWENGTTYPDIELLPAIAELFSVSADELLGIPKAEKEKQAQELCDEFCRVQNSVEYTSLDEWYEKLAGIIRKLRVDYADCDAVWKFWLNSREDILQNDKIMPEVRLFAETRLTKVPSSVDVIEKMVAIEDDDHIEAFLKLYATPYDIGRDELLRQRYMFRHEYDKAAPLMNQKLLEVIYDAVTRRPMYMNLKGKNLDDGKTLEHCFVENTTRLGILHAFAQETPTPMHPITCGKGIDYWAEVKIDCGIRRACYLTAMGNHEEAFTVLEDVISLLENVMKITDKIKLETSRFTPAIIWTAEENWCNPNAQPGPLERYIYIESSNQWCHCVYPSAYLHMLTARHGWEWFDPIRNDPRYKSCIERVKALIITKEQ